MDFSPSLRAAQLIERVGDFISSEIKPVEAQYYRDLERQRFHGDPWTPLPVLDELRTKARERGLWNLFLPFEYAGEYAERFFVAGGEGLTNVDYAQISEVTGRSTLAPYAFNCNDPDSGNMEVLLGYGNDQQRKEWLEPLLDGRISSAFAMTEPDVASSDAANMEASVVVDGDEVVLDGRKSWVTGVGHPDCRVLLVMGVSDPDAPRHSRHSMVIVPRDAPGVRVERMTAVMGRYHEPFGFGEISFANVRVPLGNVLGGLGRASDIAQDQLGAGRVHNCMRLIGLAETSLDEACRRATARTAFGRPLAELGGNRERIADARIAINQARLLVLYVAWRLDTEGPFASLSEISQIKVVVPNMAERVIDMAIQLCGSAGFSNDLPLASAWTKARSLRMQDGPDEVHRHVISRIELEKHRRKHSREEAIR